MTRQELVDKLTHDMKMLYAHDALTPGGEWGMAQFVALRVVAALLFLHWDSRDTDP